MLRNRTFPWSPWSISGPGSPSHGLIAPPVGLNVYVVNNIARDVPMGETYKGVFPFLAWDALRVVLLLLFPAISLGLVHLLFK